MFEFNSIVVLSDKKDKQYMITLKAKGLANRRKLAKLVATGVQKTVITEKGKEA